MIPLFHIPNHIIDTSKFSNLLSDKVVEEFEQEFAEYVGAKYACSFNSATSAIFLMFNGKNRKIRLPSIMPPVVPNALVNGGNKIEFYDDVNWVGHPYVLYEDVNFKVIDSAQHVEKKQFINCAESNDLMIFSFYPTKPISGCDGGMVVSNDKEKIETLRTLTLNGMSKETNAWDRSLHIIGWKMYMNSIQAEIAIRNLREFDRKQEQLDKIRTSYDVEFGKHKSMHLYRIKVANNKKFIEEMKKCNITCGIHYKALHLNNLYNSRTISLPFSEIEEKHTVSIPYHEKLTKEEIIWIIKHVNKFKNIQ